MKMKMKMRMKRRKSMGEKGLSREEKSVQGKGYGRTVALAF